MPRLQVKDMRLYYSTLRGVVRAVDYVSFDIGEGEALGIVGESGSGKTSLGLSLMRLLPRNVHTFEGSISLNGTELKTLPEEEFRRNVRWRKIAMVFQGAMNALNPVLRVEDQIAEPLLNTTSTSREEARKRVEDLLKMVGLSKEVARRYPHELSGGMKQRVLIAMALILDPQILIMDEPTSALDVSIQAQIMNLMKRLKSKLNLSILFITHDIALASDICDRLGVVYAGELAEIGPSETILTAPKHPYTQLLLASIPKLTGSEMPKFIPGQTPDLANPPSGCRFHPRCPYVFQPCSQQNPSLIILNQQHSARCWLLEKS
ncbi:MAG: ABC transporter ATP-binding protein [Thaumarchaeota archaeon]|nr:ABC transporter ATP-binding protein [Nitrososphaerota archaeon]